MAIVDINNLKIINDTFGHPAGDDIIKFVAGMVKSAIRSEDTLIRYGGDEFLIIFNDVNVEQARKIMSGLKQMLQRGSRIFIHFRSSNKSS